MKRRDVLRTGGLAALGLGLGCSSRSTPEAPAAPSRAAVRLPVPDVSWDRIIRTTVGLRPHRPPGFVLRAEKVDAKTVIHNYGHGGAGMSLSWGTAEMAAEMALEHQERRAAVIGSGVVGLTTARQLQRRGFEVTLYAADVPPNTTSNMSFANWSPMSGLLSFRRRTPEFEKQFQRAVVSAYQQLQLLVGTRYGISWIYGYTPANDASIASGSNPMLPDEVQTAQVLLRPGEHPFPTPYALQTTTLRIEPSIYLEALVRDVIEFGGKTVIRKLESLRQVMSLEEPLIVNCSGLGAKELFDDEELVPLKGQLVVMVPQPEVNYATYGGVGPPNPKLGMAIHMISRSDGLILGGTTEPDNWSLDVNEDARKIVVDGQIALFDAMRSGRGPTPST